MAVTLSTLVVGIALYHYLRIFGSWSSAFELVDGTYVETGRPFNEGYRDVDWLLTVPLLLAELVVVLKLAPSKTRSLLVRLSVAAVAMIALGYPGEIADPESTTRTVHGLRWLVLATWGVYPLAYIAPSVIDDAATAEVVRQVGYSLDDVLAKPLFGLVVLAIALTKADVDEGPLVAEPASGDAEMQPS